jgi:hypothetical protein
VVSLVRFNGLSRHRKAFSPLPFYFTAVLFSCQQILLRKVEFTPGVNSTKDQGYPCGQPQGVLKLNADKEARLWFFPVYRFYSFFCLRLSLYTIWRRAALKTGSFASSASFSTHGANPFM